jgi:hypothetical protein
MAVYAPDPGCLTSHCTVQSPVTTTVNVAGFGAMTVWLEGPLTVQGVVDVYTNGVVVTVPLASLITASNSVPLAVPAGIVNVHDVAPAIAVNVEAPGSSSYHWIVAGGPVQVTVSAGVPEVDSVGPVHFSGAVTVSVAGCVVAEPLGLVNTASYSVPDTAVVVAGVVYVSEVAPAIGVKPLAPGACDSHCTVGAGLPLAAAVNVAVAPASTVVPTGCVVTAGATLPPLQPLIVNGVLEVAVAAFQPVSELLRSALVEHDDDASVCNKLSAPPGRSIEIVDNGRSGKPLNETVTAPPAPSASDAENVNGAGSATATLNEGNPPVVLGTKVIVPVNTFANNGVTIEIVPTCEALVASSAVKFGATVVGNVNAKLFNAASSPG